MNAIHKASRASRWALILISAVVLSTGALAQGSPSTTAKPAKSTAKAPAKARVPLLIEQRSVADDGLARDWPEPDFGIDKHRSYAMQWYLMAAFSILLFIVLSVRRDRPAAP